MIEALGSAALGVVGVLAVVMLPVRVTAVPDDPTDLNGRLNVSDVVLFLHLQS